MAAADTALMLMRLQGAGMKARQFHADMPKALGCPDCLLAIATLTRDNAKAQGATHICAVEPDAIPIAAGCALLGTPGFYRRTDEKAHGTAQRYEGVVPADGAPILAVSLTTDALLDAEAELRDRWRVVGIAATLGSVMGVDETLQRFGCVGGGHAE